MNAQNAKDYLPLVQALAEGKTIQQAGPKWEWIDLAYEVSFCDAPNRYRIKQEPREIWSNRYPDGYEGEAVYESAEKAKLMDHTNERAVQVRYREVIE